MRALSTAVDGGLVLAKTLLPSDPQLSIGASGILALRRWVREIEDAAADFRRYYEDGQLAHLQQQFGTTALQITRAIQWSPIDLEAVTNSSLAALAESLGAIETMHVHQRDAVLVDALRTAVMAAGAQAAQLRRQLESVHLLSNPRLQQPSP